jgi:dipeptidyl aminopeptidase/acylaminoacyl peptidase
MFDSGVKRSLVSMLLVAAAGWPLEGQQPAEQRRWSVDDVLAMKGVGEVAVSPDGRWVAFVVTSRDLEANVNRSSIWLVASDGSSPARRLTAGPRTDRAPQWSPDGRWVAFLSDRGEGRRLQVYGIDPAGGEAWQITRHEMPITAFRISPDGQRLAYLARATPSRAEQELERQRGRPIVRDSAYASEYTRVWVVPATGREPAEGRLATPDGFDVTTVVWGPDSRALAWSAKPTPTLRSLAAAAVYVQSEPGAEARRVTSMPGEERVVAWTAEPGLIISGSGEAVGTANSRLWLVPVTGGEPIPLTNGLDENAGYVWAGPRELLVEASVRTGRGLFRIPLQNGRTAGPPQRISDGGRFYSGFSAAAGGAALAFVGESPNEAPDVYFSATVPFAPRRLTQINPQTATLAHGETRLLQWRSAADSEAIEGVLTLPVGYPGSGRVPLVVLVHGGPAGVASLRYPAIRGAYPVQVLTSMGYAVFQPNYRGSTGYGARFRSLNRGDISGKDWIDIESGVSALLRAGIADSTKMALVGWSFGGHLTYWGITHSTRYSAASAGAGATDLISMYSQTDIPEFYHTYLGPPPWEDLRLYEERSSYRYVKNAATPLLIQVGENDRRVPAEQSIQFYEAMKGIGKAPVKLVIYPGQGHSIEEPRLQRDLMQRNVEWISYWVPVSGPKPPVRVEANTVGR